jgi:hypothetical protein
MYEFHRGRRPPIAIQRSLGLRRQFPRVLGVLGYLAALTAAPRLFDDGLRDGEPAACYLILARKLPS